ncbi:MAG: hypothetical protein EB127_31335 [Alphaproteobacteria bacterium]|nr:hypothetical protein [Alphaproteobacteria bacterium]
MLNEAVVLPAPPFEEANTIVLIFYSTLIIVIITITNSFLISNIKLIVFLLPINIHYISISY